MENYPTENYIEVVIVWVGGGELASAEQILTGEDPVRRLRVCSSKFKLAPGLNSNGDGGSAAIPG